MALLFQPNIKKLAQNKDVEGLIKAMFSNDNRIRYDAAKALESVDVTDPGMMAPLILALKSDNYWVRLAAIKSIYKLVVKGFNPPIESIVVELEDKNGFIRNEIVMILTAMEDQRAIAPLLRLFSGKIPKPSGDADKFHGVSGALRTYAKRFPELIAEELMAGLRSNEFPLSSSVIEILMETHQKDTLEVLLSALHQESYDGHAYTQNGSFNTSYLQEKAVEALGRLGDKKAVQPLLTVLRDKSRDPQIRIKVIQALTAIGDASASGSLLDICLEESISKLVDTAKIGLDKINGNNRIGSILDAIRSKEAETCDEAARELAVLVGDDRVVKYLQKSIAELDRQIERYERGSTEAENFEEAMEDLEKVSQLRKSCELSRDAMKVALSRFGPNTVEQSAE